MVYNMLKKFSLRNYRNFKDDIYVDFENIAGYQFNTDCITDGTISKMLIYGRNATGKTNLGRAFMDICASMFYTPNYNSGGNFLNADSSENAAVFSYTFQFDGKELVYRYTRFSNSELRDEELRIDGITIFKCDFAKKEYNFENLNYIGAETANRERYLQSLYEDETGEEFTESKLPFLRWLVSNVALENDSILLQLSGYVRRMIMMNAGGTIPSRFRSGNDSFFESLEEPEKLRDLEAFLNAMGITCQLVLEKLPDGRRELYFSHKKLVPFYENASSGTLALVDLYCRLISKVWDASFLYLDEFDAFYHYEMAENVMKYFKRRYPRCQMIMTSHNTNLMTNRLMRPDCVFILSRSGSLTSLCNATQRELREGHNLEKMYISGEFEKYE
jgi:hypothetical protein